jgi:hypothetical protein
MSTTAASILHLSRRATALAALALALVGTAAFTTAAHADFTLNSGKITFTAGATTGNPPTGSWVSLPLDSGAGYFTNPTSSWVGTPDKLFTVIRPGAAPAGLALGATQPAGGIIGSATDTFNGIPWTLITTPGTADPTLTFAGSHNGTGTRLLTGGDLSALRVLYGGNTYNVGTGFGPGAHRIQSLTGEIHGSTTGTGVNAATITLSWTTDLTEPGFDTFRAQFQLVGRYDRP